MCFWKNSQIDFLFKFKKYQKQNRYETISNALQKSETAKQVE